MSLNIKFNSPAFLLVLGLAALVSTNANAQDSGNLFTPSFSDAAQSKVQDVAPKTDTMTMQGSSGKSLEELLRDIRLNEKAISHEFSAIPVGFPEAQKKHMAKIRQMQKETENLKMQLSDAAATAYRKDPSANSIAAKIVYATLANKIDAAGGESFDPRGALELADLMLKSGLENAPMKMEKSESDTSAGGVSFENVAYQAFRASFAIQDYARADLMLQKIESRGTTLKAVYRQVLADARTKWQRELMIRRLEKNTNDLPRIKIETSEGDIVVELYENHAPQTVGNFVNLVESGFYDEKPFYLVRPGDCARTGCKNGDGTGEIGYQIPCEYDREQIRHHFSGTLSMHNTGRDTGDSQFFITHQRKPEYDGKYTAFGRVIEGMDVVYKLNKVDKTPYARAGGGEPSKIIKATVLRKRQHSYQPSRVAEKMQNLRDDG